MGGGRGRVGLPASSDLSLGTSVRPQARFREGWGLPGAATLQHPHWTGCCPASSVSRARLTEVHPVLPIAPRSEGVLPAHPVSSPHVHPLLPVPGWGSPGQRRGRKGVSTPPRSPAPAPIPWSPWGEAGPVRPAHAGRQHEGEAPGRRPIYLPRKSPEGWWANLVSGPASEALSLTSQ